MLCSICRQPHGAHFQCCAGKKCCTAFHPLCARRAGLPHVAIDEADSSAIQRMESCLRRLLRNNPRRFRGLLADAGVLCGNGMRLLAFCERHKSCALAVVSTPKSRPASSDAGKLSEMAALEGTVDAVRPGCFFWLMPAPVSWYCNWCLDQSYLNARARQPLCRCREGCWKGFATWTLHSRACADMRTAVCHW
jgi:hypothetical protein